ncbi:MAG: ABC transporter permease [Peptostreptococcaceae bacterium]|jgi:simple sugar transport system permease protein|nr:ABC transporter permease [Peptostreptococcaceae bacterium]
MNKLKNLFNDTFKFTMIAILLGFLVGSIILMFAGINPIEAYSVVFVGIFGKPSSVAWSVVTATPIILTGLSVAFAFRTGLFNIGAEGQFMVGALAAAVVGYFVKAPAIVHIPLTIMAGMLAGAIWGGCAGFLKAKYGVNEVITTIMLNWIALYLSNYVTMLEGFRKPHTEASYKIQETAMIKIDWLRSFIGPVKVNWGIVFAIIAILIIAYVLNKTTLGFELRAVGFNKFAAEYGGINVNSSMIKSMAIAGLLAGLAGTLHVMGYAQKITVLAASEGYGFDGISVSLIGNNTPLGCLFAGLFFGALKYGGRKMNSIGAPTEVVNIVMGSIIYFIAAINLIKMTMFKFKTVKRGEN